MSVRCVVLAGLVFVFAEVSHAQVTALLPHRAVYDLTLARADAGSGIADVRGRMVMEWTDACDGYTLNQRIRTHISRSQGNEVVTDLNVSTWESKDGRTFRFGTRHVVNGRLGEAARGRAELKGDREPGQVRVVKPKRGGFVLPRGTVFPTEHMALLVAQAQAGASRVQSFVFDGSNTERVHQVIAFIGKRNPVRSYRGTGSDVLNQLASWPVHLAFFDVDNRLGVPEYEVRFRLFANSVAADVVLDYGDFAFRGALTQLDVLEAYC